MSLPNFSGQSALFATLTSGFFGPEDRYRLLAQKIYPVLVQARGTLEQVYCSDNGRPGVEPVLLAGVTLLQFLEGAPDRQAVEMLHYHLGWQFALNCTVESATFHPSTLANFRQRLIGHDLSRVVFNQLLETLQKAGLVERKGKQRLDSTQVIGLLSRMSRLECLRETLRLALQELEQSAALFNKPGWWPTLVERYVSSKLDYRTESNALKEKMNQAGADAWTLIEWVKKLSDSTIAQGPQSQLLVRVLHENFQCKCVGAGQPHRTLVVGQHHTQLQTRRQEQKTEAFQEKSRRRNAIEGTQSELVRAPGLRKARYRGLEKNRLQNYFIGAACNAKRWIRRIVWEIRQAEIGAKLSPMVGCAGP